MSYLASTISARLMSRNNDMDAVEFFGSFRVRYQNILFFFFYSTADVKHSAAFHALNISHVPACCVSHPEVIGCVRSHLLMYVSSLCLVPSGLRSHRADDDDELMNILFTVLHLFCLFSICSAALGKHTNPPRAPGSFHSQLPGLSSELLSLLKRTDGSC